MFCPNCGTRVSKTAKFCRECGCDLAVDTQQALPQVGSEQKCAIHPKMNSIGVCDKCGTAVCVICKSEVKDKLYCPNCIDDVMQLQRDLDWLQNFREQYEEVIRLNLEMQDVAKGIPLTSQESETKPPSGVREQLKELQRSFAAIEKSLRSGTKPKSSDLREMSFSLENACKYYGIACVAYRKMAEKPSGSVETYTNERLEKASNAMDKVSEQLALISNKSVAVEAKDSHEADKKEKSECQPISKCAEHPQNDAIGKCADCGIAICRICSTALADKLYCPSCTDKIIQGSIEKTSESVTRKITTTLPTKARPNTGFVPPDETSEQRLKWFRRHPSGAMVLVWLIVVALTVPLSIKFGSPLSFVLFSLLCLVTLIIAICDGVLQLKREGLSLWWLLLLIGFIPGIFTLSCVVQLKRTGRSLGWLLILPLTGWLLGYLIIHSLSDLNFLTNEQMYSGLYIERDGNLLDLKRDEKLLLTFDTTVATRDYIREEAQKFVNPTGR